MTNKYELAPSKQSMIGTWTSFVVVFIFFFIIGRYAFGWTHWWIWFPIGGTLIGAVTTTIQYFTMDPTLCPNCGQRVSEKKKHCPHCSHRFLWRCPNCNAKVRPDERFCDDCGHALQESVKTGEPKEAPVVNIPNPEYQNPSFAYCQLCGTHIDKERQKFCPSCGVELL